MSPQPTAPGPPRRFASYGTLALGVTLAGGPKFPKTPKSQTEAAGNPEFSLECPGARKLVLSVGKFPAFIQFGNYNYHVGAGQASIIWQPPQLFPASLSALQRDFDALRAWNAEPANESEIIASPA